MSSYIQTLFLAAVTQVAYRLPLLLLLLVFIVIAVIRKQRHPQASLLTVVGLSTYILTAVAGSTYMAWVIDMAPADGRTVAQSANYALVGGIVLTGFQLLGLGLALSAIFVGRSKTFEFGQYNEPLMPHSEELVTPEPGPTSYTTFHKGSIP